jgi:M6 family metalloprotease-like protein
MFHLPRTSLRAVSLLAVFLALVAAPAIAKTVQVEGTLSLRWGDPIDGSATAPKLQAEIAGKNGYTYAIDAERALAAGLPLLDMNGQEVAGVVDPSRKSVAGFELQGLASKSGTSPLVTESRPWINLLCKFADVADEPTTVARVDAAFAPGAGLTDYWMRTSQGAIDLGRTRTLGWFVLPSPRSTYVDASNNPNLGKLLNDCASAAGAALSDAVQAEDHAGVTVMVNGSLGCCAWGGNITTTLGGVNKTWRVTWMPPAGYLNLSLLAHELGHTFGMAHSNNSDQDSNTYDNPWDLLSDSQGHAMRDAQFGSMPKTPSAYHLDRAGWLADDERVIVGGDTIATVDLQRIDQAGAGIVRMMRIESPEWTDGRYYVVETRVRNGVSEGALPDSGVVIYQVIPGRAQPAWLVDASDPASNYSNTRSVVFKSGDSYIAPDRSFELNVLAANTNGFQVKVKLPGPGFGSSFE